MEVLKGQEDGEIRGNYPTMPNISQLKRGMGGSQGEKGLELGGLKKRDGRGIGGGKGKSGRWEF